MDKKLINAVIKNLGYESLNDPECIDELKNIANCPYGMAGGFGNFIYYSDTTTFFNQNRKLIITQLKDQAFEIGVGVIEMVAGFNGLKDNEDITIHEIGNVLFCIDTDNHDEKMIIKNALAWYSAEEVAFEVVNQLEDA